jgi:hypothetical protein
MNTPALPDWAKRITPVDMDGAAFLLGISRRFLVDALKAHPHYERRGAKKVFYPEHIELLREKMSCQDSPSKSATASGTPMAQSEESAFEKALALATGKSPKKPSSSTKRGSGNVIHMERKP